MQVDDMGVVFPPSCHKRHRNTSWMVAMSLKKIENRARNEKPALGL